MVLYFYETTHSLLRVADDGFANKYFSIDLIYDDTSLILCI